MKTTRLFLALLLLAAAARAAFPTIALKPVSLGQLRSPTTITNAGDGSGRLFVCEQRGRIRILRDGMLQPTPFLDLSPRLVAERAGFDEAGLLGLAFHPGYEVPASPGYRKFYVFYSATSPNQTPNNQLPVPVYCRSTVAEYQVSLANPDVADFASERILLSFDKPQFNHNGGDLAFGPDGLLYFSTGDGGGANDNRLGHSGNPGLTAVNPPIINGTLGNAQDKTNLMGKIHRIDPLGSNAPGGQYGIPATNPFVGAGGGVREEIYAFGLRNPWRFSFDPPTGRLFCADVGQGKVEEVDLIVSGGNYGWRPREGTFDFDNTAPNGGLPLIPPIAQYEHPNLVPSLGLLVVGVSVTGGYVYRGAAFPALVGKYVFADWGTANATPDGRLLGLEETTPGVWALSLLSVLGGNPINGHIAIFGTDEQGEMYLGTNTTQNPTANDPVTGLPAGGIYKIVPPVPLTAALEPTLDNSLFSEDGALSNGQGHLFSGRIALGDFRRALLAFAPAAALPAGAEITSATLELRVTNANSAATPMTLHRVLENWGEGASDAGDPGGTGAAAEPGDATWTHRLFSGTAWSTAGGVFTASASATASVAGNGTTAAWPSATNPALLADARAMFATPATNFGWLLRGDEAAATQNARRFASGENATASQRPRLLLDYLTPPPLTRRETWLRQHFLPGQFVDDVADLDGDTLSNQIEYSAGFSPLVTHPAAARIVVEATLSEEDAIVCLITFRRDPRATDLTYRLQTSPDLATWTTLCQSVAGAAPTGLGFLEENPLAGEAPVLLVTVQDVVFSPGTRLFARLVVIRQP